MCKQCVPVALCPTHVLEPENEITACPGHQRIDLRNSNHKMDNSGSNWSW